MRTAIILSGYYRTWDKTYQNFIDTFSHLNADIFVSTYDRQYGYQANIVNEFNAHHDNILLEQQIFNSFEILKPKHIIIDSSSVIDDIIDIEIQSCHERMRFKNSYGQSRKVKIISDYVRNYEQINNFKYDYILKTRPDLIYNRDVNFKIESNQVLVDTGNHYPNDWFFMVNREDYYYVVDFLFFEFFNFSVDNSYHLIPHTLHYNAFKSRSLDIVEQKLVHSVLRLSNDNNTTQHHTYDRH